jgi:protein lifeguard
MASNYSQPPPSYTGPKNNARVNEEDMQPLLSPAGPSSGAYYDQPLAGDVPDDFKARKTYRIVIVEL